jgi:hypothetical protein
VKKNLTAVPIPLTNIGDVEDSGCVTTATDLCKGNLASLVVLKVTGDDNTISICLSMLNVRAKSG